MRLRISLFVMLLSAVLAAPALAQSDGGSVMVLDIEGPADQVLLDFVTAAIEDADAQLIVLLVDSPGISSGDPAAMYAAVESSITPIAMWVGPDPAATHGGMAQLLAKVDFAGAAPGVQIGYLEPTVIAGGGPAVDGSLPAELFDDVVRIGDAPVPGLVDEISPTIGQFIASLDGRTARGVALETAQTIVGDDGIESVVASVNVQFVKPDLWDRFLRLGSRPEATFFFLVIGLSAAVFEFYAAGVGITAAVAALSLFVAGYGLATLPMNWVAFGITLLSLLVMTIDFQRTRLGVLTVAGGIGLLAGGLTFSSAAPQFGPRWWAVVLTVLGIVLFYMVALTTVARSRFSTRTLGREHLVGKHGTAETAFDPEGVVNVDGARWQARSHRAAGIAAGDRVQVTEVKGIVLEIAPIEPPGEGEFANS